MFIFTTEYDKNDPKSILAYGQRLVGHALCDFIDPSTISGRDKGRLGAYVEKYYGIPRNSTAMPDFASIGGVQLELKTNPLKRLASGEIRVKERLVFNIINYCDICNESWETSSFLAKNKNMLLVSYFHSPGEAAYEHTIYQVRLLRLDRDIPAADFEQMHRDWEYIVNLIRRGRAEDLSEGDTSILGACTKGSTAASSFRDQPFSTTRAKQRAFSWKQNYLNAHLHMLIGVDD